MIKFKDAESEKSKGAVGKDVRKSAKPPARETAATDVSGASKTKPAKRKHSGAD